MSNTIAVIVPVYKVEKYIERCIKSVLVQTFAEFELILIDDGSPDSCGEICDEYAERDKRIKVIHQENLGLSKARNTGIEYALKKNDIKWLTFIDSDDWVHPQYLELLYRNVKKSGFSISVCEHQKVFTEKEIVKELFAFSVYEILSKEFYLQKCTLATVAWGKLYSKELFCDARYPLGIINEDEHVTYKIICKVDKVVYIEAPLYYYYQHAESIMAQRWSLRHLDVLKAYKEQIEYFKDNADIELMVARRYIFSLSYQLKNVNKYYPKYKEKKALRSELKRLLKVYGKDLGMCIIKDFAVYIQIIPMDLSLFYKASKLRRNIVEILRSEGVVGVANRIKGKVKHV